MKQYIAQVKVKQGESSIDLYIGRDGIPTQNIEDAERYETDKAATHALNEGLEDGIFTDQKPPSIYFSTLEVNERSMNLRPYKPILQRHKHLTDKSIYAKVGCVSKIEAQKGTDEVKIITSNGFAMVVDTVPLTAENKGINAIYNHAQGQTTNGINGEGMEYPDWRSVVVRVKKGKRRDVKMLRSDLLSRENSERIDGREVRTIEGVRVSATLLRKTVRAMYNRQQYKGQVITVSVGEKTQALLLNRDSAREGIVQPLNNQ